MEGAGTAANAVPPLTQRSLLRPPSLPPGAVRAHQLLHAGSSLNMSLLPSLSGMTSHTMAELATLLPPSLDRGGGNNGGGAAAGATGVGVTALPPTPAPLPLPSLTISASTVAALLMEGDDGGYTLPPPSPPPPARRQLAPRTPSTKKRAPKKKRKAAGEQTSSFRGVTLHQRSGRYEAHCWVPALRRQVFAGAWRTELAATRAFDVVRLAAQGGRSSSSLDLNFPASMFEAELDALADCNVDALVVALRAQAAAGDDGPRVRGVVF